MSSQSEELVDPYFQPSKLTENFARLCHLILTICSDLLRDIIGRHISPSELTNTIDNKRNVLWERFSKQQQKEIYPGHARVLKAKNFDISVCYILLRNICGIPPHAAGWGNDPEPGDYSVSACIDIIRIERNKVCAHSARGTIDQPEFQHHWNKIKEAIIHLEQKEIGGDWYERGVECLWSCSLSPFKNEEYIEEMRNVKYKLDCIDECIKGLEAKVGSKMACKRARLDQLEESQNATLTDISDQIEDLQKNVVDKVHGLRNYLIDQNTKSMNELTIISKDIQQKIGDDDSYGESLLKDVKDIKRKIGFNDMLLDGASLHEEVKDIKQIIGFNGMLLDGTSLHEEVKDIKQRIGFDDMGHDDKSLQEEIKGLKSKFERTANDIEWNITEKIIGKMKELENALFKKGREPAKSDVHPCEKGKVPNTDSCDQSGINCSTSDISNIDKEIASFNHPRRSKSYELRFKENERVIWVCGWEKSCWVISLCTSGKVDMENNKYKIYRMKESRKGLKIRQELAIHEPVLQGISIDDEGRLVYISQSKMCVRYVTKQNIIKTLTDLDETCVSYALCFDFQGLKIIARRDDTFFIAEKHKKYYDDDDDDNDDETEISAHLEVPRRLFRKRSYIDSNVYAILHEGITVCKRERFEDQFEVSVTINDGSGHGLLDLAMIEKFQLKGLLLAYSNGIDLVDWEGNFLKRIYNETGDTIRTISVSDGNLWIGHESNTVDRIVFEELGLFSLTLLL